MSIGEIIIKNDIKRRPIASTIPIYANIVIFSWAIIQALYGTLIRFTKNVIAENMKTQFVAFNLLAGIVIFVLRNHIPIENAKIRITKPMISCIIIAVEKILFVVVLFPLPNSNVINRLIAVESELDIMENIVTKPPTAL